MTKGGLNPLEMFKAGGWVMYPILTLSIVSTYVILERLIVIMREKMKIKPEKVLDMFLDAMERNQGDKAKTVEEITELCQQKGGVCCDVLISVFHKFKDGAQKGMDPVKIKQWMTEAAESQATQEIPRLESHLVALAVISNVSTLMGLFGTVFGMIEAFTAMANSPGGVKADEMAGGIAIALVATLGGLLVAIPSLILYNVMKGYIETFVLSIEDTVMKIVDTLAE